VFGALAEGRDPGAPYLLADMADDAAGLLDALGIARAHVAGVSMGGMIGQMLAARHPDKVLSLVSVMSTTGNPAVPPATPEAQAVLFARPAATDLESLVEHALKAQIAIQSPAWPVNPETERPLLRAGIQRAYHPDGRGLRQMIAVIASGDRRAASEDHHRPDRGAARRCRSAGAGARAARTPPRLSRAPSCGSSRAWATTCPRRARGVRRRGEGAAARARQHKKTAHRTGRGWEEADQIGDLATGS
jgi:pimeloyl-ACP methyl ester carboxylesterase